MSAAAEPELKPCPFCGNEPHAEPYDDDHFVACENEDCASQPSVIDHTAAGAAAKWNRRAP